MNKIKLIIFTVVFFIVLCITGFLFVFKKSQPSVFFYNVPDNKREKIEEAISEVFKQKNGEDVKLPFNFKSYYGKEPLSHFLKNDKSVCLVIAENGREVFNAREYLSEIDINSQSAVPSSLLNMFFDEENNRTVAYPFLFEPFEFLYDTDMFSELNITPPNSIRGWTEVLRKCKRETKYPMICSGADDRTLLFLISTIMNYERQKIESDKLVKFADRNSSEMVIPKELKIALDILCGWKTEGLIHPEWFNLIDRDVESLMSFNMNAAAFMGIGQNRLISKDIINRFSSVTLPSYDENKKLNLVASVFVISKLKNRNRYLKLSNSIFSFCTSNDGQFILSSKTGYVPANSEARTYDTHALNSKFAAEISDFVLPDFTQSAFALSAEEKISLLNKLRLYIKINGEGFTEE